MRPGVITAIKLAYVALMLAIPAAGTLNLALEMVPDAPLDGVEVTAEAPAITFAAVRTEKLQEQLVQWFDQRWGLRGYAIRTDNTLVLHAFAETRSTNSVVVLGDGVLILDEDLNFVNRADTPDAQVVAAKRIARVQEKLRARGSVIVPVIIPGKTSFYEARIPSSWKRRGAYGVADRNVYGAFAQALKDNGVRFVDGRRLLHDRDVPPEQTFAPTGRHWRASAACRVLQEALDVARPDLSELGGEQIDCSVYLDPDPPIVSEDFDLYRLLNVWGPRPRFPVEVLNGKHGSAALQIPTLFVGSSFVWKFVRASRELELLRPSLFYYYDSSVVDTTTMLITKKVEPHTDAWRADTLVRLIIVGILETYIPGDGERFFQELEEELDGR